MRSYWDGRQTLYLWMTWQNGNSPTMHGWCTKADVPIGEIVEYPGVIKMAETLDPDGNKVVFVQDISGEG